VGLGSGLVQEYRIKSHKIDEEQVPEQAGRETQRPSINPRFDNIQPPAFFDSSLLAQQGEEGERRSRRPKPPNIDRSAKIRSWVALNFGIYYFW